MKNIKKYIDGDLSEAATEKVTEDLLRAKFDRETRQKWSNILAEEQQLHRQPRPRRVAMYKYLAVAASLAFLLVMGQVLYTPSSPSAIELADAYLEHSKMTEFGGVLRAGDAEEVPTLRKEANTAYAQHKYQEAIQFAEQIIRTPQAEPPDYLILGLSHLYAGDAAQAVTVLEKGQTSSQASKKYEREMDWFLGIAYLKAQQAKMAKPILENIVAQKSWNHETAEKMLKDL